jgi:RHS repeat-associated protein
MDPSGLVYLQARYYDPQLGRFLSTDPVDPDPQTGKNFNRYAYAENNPYSKYDPNGRESRDFDWISKQEGVTPPPQSEDDWLGPALGDALGVVMAPIVAAGSADVAGAALANPAAASAMVNAIAETGAGDALGGASLAAAEGRLLYRGVAGTGTSKARFAEQGVAIPRGTALDEGPSQSMCSVRM